MGSGRGQKGEVVTLGVNCVKSSQVKSVFCDEEDFTRRGVPSPLCLARARCAGGARRASFTIAQAARRSGMPPRPADGTMPCVVIDNGSGFIKSGFAGEEQPRGVLPARGLAGMGDAQPITRGIVQDWDAMEAYWDHALTNQLGIDTEECNLFVTSPLFDTKVNKERLMQTLFETFAAPGAYTAAPAVLELYAAGRENGVIVGCGAECTYAVLVHEGLPDPRTQQRSNIAGDALSAWTAELLGKSAGGAPLPLSAAAKAKEILGAVASDSTGRTTCSAGAFELPDGKKLTVSAATRVAMAEPLFDPSMLGQAGGGLAQLVAECIRQRDRDGVLESTEHGKDGTPL